MSEKTLPRILDLRNKNEAEEYLSGIEQDGYEEVSLSDTEDDVELLEEISEEEE